MNIWGTCTQRRLAEALLLLHRWPPAPHTPPPTPISPPSSLLQPEASVALPARHIARRLKKTAAAFPRPFCPRSGRRLAHRGSCYNFHFLNIFLSFSPPARPPSPALLFFLCGKKKRKRNQGYFIPSRHCDDDKWAEQDGSSDWGCCRPGVARATQCGWLQGCWWWMARCGFGQRCGSGEGESTTGFELPEVFVGLEVKWDNVSEEWRVYFIILPTAASVCFCPLLGVLGN